MLRLPWYWQAQVKNIETMKKKKLPGFIRPVDFQDYQRSVTNYIAWGREMDHNNIKPADMRHCWDNDYSQGDAYNYIVWVIVPKEKTT